MNAGLSISDIDRMLGEDADRRALPAMIREVIKYEELKSIDFRLDVSEAVNMAYVATIVDKRHENQRNARRWRTRLIWQRNKLLGIKTPTIYDKKARKL